MQKMFSEPNFCWVHVSAGAGWLGAKASRFLWAPSIELSTLGPPCRRSVWALTQPVWWQLLHLWQVSKAGGLTMRMRLTSNGKSLFIKKLPSAWKCQAWRDFSASFCAHPLVLCSSPSWQVIGKEKAREEATLCLMIEMRSGKLF